MYGVVKAERRTLSTSRSDQLGQMLLKCSGKMSAEMLSEVGKGGLQLGESSFSGWLLVYLSAFKRTGEQELKKARLGNSRSLS